MQGKYCRCCPFRSPVSRISGNLRLIGTLMRIDGAVGLPIRVDIRPIWEVLEEEEEEEEEHRVPIIFNSLWDRNMSIISPCMDLILQRPEPVSRKVNTS